MPVGFRGAVLVAPGVASYIDDSQAAAAVAPSLQSVGVVGEAERGEPNTAIALTDASTAYAVYGSGGTSTPLVDGIVRALAAGAGTVYGVRVAAATQSTATITSSATTAITVKSKEWGTLANTWSIKIGAGSVSGKKATLITHSGIEYVLDNVQKDLIQIIGVSGTADHVGSVTVDATKVSLIWNLGTAVDYTFAAYPRITNLIAAINNGGAFLASLTSGASAASRQATNTLDAMTTVAVGNSTSIATMLTANGKALVDALNGEITGALVTATFVVNTAALTNAVFPFTGAVSGFATSGTSVGQSTVGDWANAFTALENIACSVVVPMTADATKQAAAFAHAKSMSLPQNSSERIAIIGGNIGQTVSQVKTLAGAYNDKRAVVVWPGIKDYNSDGDLVTLPPYYLAAQIGGMLSGQTDQAVPMTNKPVSLFGLETIPSRADIDNLLNGGVFTIKSDPNRGFLVVQSLTTWTGDLKFARREISTVRAADQTVRIVREAVVEYIGNKSTTRLLQIIDMKVNAALTFCKSSGLIVDDPANPTLYPAYKDVIVRAVGDAYYIDFSISPAKPLNYLLITAYVN